MRKIFIAIFLLTIPALSYAQGIVPACDTDCGFDDLVQLAKNIMDFLAVAGALVASIVFAYAGWMYITSGGNSGTVSKAKEIFLKVVIGFFFILASWLIVNLILTSLGADVRGLEFLREIMS